MATETVQPAQTPAPRIGATPEGLLLGLFDRASANLSGADLDSVVGLMEEAECIVGNIRHLCDGLATLVAQDADGSHRAPVGSFQDGASVAHLLWTVGGMAGYAAGLMRLSSLADDERVVRARSTSLVNGKRNGARHG